MSGFIVSFLVGVLCIALGISNMMGNISSIHYYHRHRISEENIRPFGRAVGLGTIISGAAIGLFSILSAITLYTDKQIFITVGTAILISGLISGLGISIYAMIKYNKGIF